MASAPSAQYTQALGVNGAAEVVSWTMRAWMDIVAFVVQIVG
jgi:hypothetical protein